MANIAWSETAVTVNVGGTATVNFGYGKELEMMYTVTTSDASVATIVTSGDPLGFAGVATITGVSPGTTVTVPGGSDTQSAALTITVVSADDESYLNKRGLTHFWENIDGIKADKSSLATVATTGSYSDLIDKPTIPTVNNATLTIQKNGTDVQTFTANASSNVTANITVPTKTSDITNDSGFLTSVATANIADGAVTPAKMDLSSLGRFSGNLSGSSYSQSYSAGTAANAKVPNQVFTPVGATYNTSTGAYTITQAGWWLITGGGRGTTDANAYGAVRIQVNGTNKSIANGTGYASSSVKTTFNASVSWMGHLAANDTVALNIQSSVAITNSNSATQQHLEGLCLIPD